MPDGFDDPIEERFQIEKLVGRGAFGDVHRAVERATGTPVAVKRLSSALPDATSVQRFQREAKLLSHIESRYVVRYIAHGLDHDGRPSLVLEWLAGADLGQLQRARRLPIAEATRVVRQAALALHALHAAGVVHRDVKPANFVALSDATTDIQIKLIDLGVAHTRGEPSLTEDGFAVGTLHYMSPEQIRCERPVAPASDVFSLGVMLYELLCGVRPFADRDANALLAKILLHEPTRVRARNSEVSPALEQIVQCAMAKRASDRFASAMLMADALGDVSGVSVEPDAKTVRHQVVPSAALTSGQETTVTGAREQRVVAALFAGFASDGTFETAAATFGEIMRVHRATLHVFPGSRAIAVFGADGSSGDEVQWVARAALAARTRIAGIRLAIAACRVQVGESGLSEDAIQSGVDRLGRATTAILVDASTARLLDAGFRVEPAGSDHVLVAERGLDTDSNPKLLGHETSTVGRERELRNLDACLDECLSESAACAVLLTGPAGIGKSRLRYEWLRRLSARLASVKPYVARGDPVRAGSAFVLIAQWIRSSAGVADDESASVAHAKISTRVGRHVRASDVQRVSEFLCELIAAPVSDSASVQLTTAREDPTLMSEQLRRAWLDWLSAECAAGPVVLVVEDLHWGDLPSVNLINHALRTLEHSPLFVAAFARPEVHETFPKIWTNARLELMRVEGLLPKAAERLARQVLGDSIDAEVLGKLVERAAGNAFYLEELIRAAADGKTGTLPETVLLVVQVRLGKLSPAARRVLRVASVFGDSFWAGALVAPLGAEHDAEAVADMLRSLEADEIIERRSKSRYRREEEFGFRHALLRDSAYESLTEGDRTLVHRAAAKWLEHAGEADARVLARHCELGGDSARAVRWYTRAAERSFEGNDVDTAVSLAERGIALGAVGEALGALKLIHGNALWVRGDLRPAQQSALEALVLLTRPSPGWYGAVRLTAGIGGETFNSAWIDELAEDLVSLRETSSGDAEYVEAVARVAMIARLSGRHVSADRLAEIVAGRATEFAETKPSVAARITWVESLRALQSGDLGAWLESLQQLVVLSERTGNAAAGVSSRHNVGWAYALFGAFESAEMLLREAIHRGTKDALNVSVNAHCSLGYALAGQGRLDEARQELDTALEMYRQKGSARGEGYAHKYLSRVAILAGDAEWAEREARASLDLLGSVPLEKCVCLAALAEALKMGGRLEEARDAILESTRISAELGTSDPEEVYAHWVQATILDAAGDTELARKIMKAARERVLAAANTFQDPALRQSYVARVRENAAVLASPLGRS